MIDFITIKADNDLEQTIVDYLGEPDRTGKWLCPFHGEKTPSFGVWANGERFKCFGCGAEGDVLDFIMMIDNLPNVGQAAKKLGGYVLDLGLSPAEIKAKKVAIKAEQERKKQKRLAEKQAKETAALSRINSLTDKADWYHGQVGQALDYWHLQGINDDLIKSYRFGYAPLCPLLYPDEIKQCSYVIPYYENETLVSIRHRLSHPNGHGKYRPEFAGLPPRLFDADSLQGKDINDFYLPKNEAIIIEGEIKAVVIGDRIGCARCGIPGITNWRPEWSKYFEAIKTVYIIPDPGLKTEIRNQQIGRIAGSLKCQVIVISVPAKPDDLFVKYGISPERFLKYLERGRLWQ